METSFTLEGDNGEEGDSVGVHDTISNVILEVPAPILNQSRVPVGDEEEGRKSDKPQIITTNTEHLSKILKKS